MEMYYRVSYNDMGIYEALKKELWKQKKDPKKEWKNLINSNLNINISINKRFIS